MKTEEIKLEVVDQVVILSIKEEAGSRRLYENKSFVRLLQVAQNSLGCVDLVELNTKASKGDPTYLDSPNLSLIDQESINNFIEHQLASFKALEKQGMAENVRNELKENLACDLCSLIVQRLSIELVDNIFALLDEFAIDQLTVDRNSFRDHQLLLSMLNSTAQSTDIEIILT